jgi:hypothetical protein
MLAIVLYECKVAGSDNMSFIIRNAFHTSWSILPPEEGKVTMGRGAGDEDLARRDVVFFDAGGDTDRARRGTVPARRVPLLGCGLVCRVFFVAGDFWGALGRFMKTVHIFLCAFLYQ